MLIENLKKSHKDQKCHVLFNAEGIAFETVEIDGLDLIYIENSLLKDRVKFYFLS